MCIVIGQFISCGEARSALASPRARWPARRQVPVSARSAAILMTGEGWAAPPTVSPTSTTG